LVVTFGSSAISANARWSWAALRVLDQGRPNVEVALVEKRPAAVTVGGDALGDSRMNRNEIHVFRRAGRGDRDLSGQRVGLRQRRCYERTQQPDRRNRGKGGRRDNGPFGNDSVPFPSERGADCGV
jgi:hypothetical protein